MFFVYQPAWHGGFIWDDNAHVTRPELRSWHGLFRIWFDVGATQQYYPLVHSAFWVQHRLWGDAVLGYHLVNILLHAAAAVMVGLILRRLAIPGAFLAAAIFAPRWSTCASIACGRNLGSGFRAQRKRRRTPNTPQPTTNVPTGGFPFFFPLSPLNPEP